MLPSLACFRLLQLSQLSYPSTQPLQANQQQAGLQHQLQLQLQRCPHPKRRQSQKGVNCTTFDSSKETTSARPDPHSSTPAVCVCLAGLLLLLAMLQIKWFAGSSTCHRVRAGAGAGAEDEAKAAHLMRKVLESKIGYELFHVALIKHFGKYLTAVCLSLYPSPPLPLPLSLPAPAAACLCGCLFGLGQLTFAH